MTAAAQHSGSSRRLARYRLGHRLRRLTPLAVWTAVLVVASILYVRQQSGLTVTGFAQGTSYRVAAETTGRLQRLDVRLHQEVSRGQIVASLEDDELRLRLREARAELDRLSHEIGRQRALHEVDQKMDLRRFAVDAANARVDYLAALTALAEDRIELQGLEITLNRSQELQESEVAPVAQLDEDRIAFEALEAKIARHESMVDAMDTACREADVRYRDYQSLETAGASDSNVVIQPLESAITVQEVRIEMATLDIVKRVLRAPAGGRVVAIFSHVGEVVAAGQPVISILEPQATELVAYLPDDRILDLRAGDEVEVRRAADPGRTFVSAIACLGSSVEQMPMRLDPAATAPRWGLAVFVPVPESLAVKPGEAFEISF